MKIKRLTLTALLALAGGVLVSLPARAATFTNGDLLLGFYASSGTGSDQTYVFNIGLSTGYRNGTASSNLSISLGADLASTFGSAWFNRSDLFWGIAGVQNNSQSGAAFNGDPVRTNYVSIAETTFGTQSSAPVIQTSTSRGAVAVDIASVQTGTGGFSTATATSNSGNLGAKISASNDNSFDELAAKLNNDGGLNIFGSFANGTSGTALDLYRILNTNTNANPAGTVGTGSYEGTFTISDAGLVSYQVTPVPEPSTYAMIGLGVAIFAVRAYRRMRNPVRA